MMMIFDVTATVFGHGTCSRSGFLGRFGSDFLEEYFFRKDFFG
jgi:hypothetical protein